MLRSTSICPLVLSLSMLAACTGGGGGSTSPTTPTVPASLFKSGSITADQFITALNSLESNGANQSYVELYEEQVIRSYVAGEDQWFVIWDDKFEEYKAVSLRYIRSLTYYAYHASDVSLAEEFRDEEQDDLALGFSNYLNGDYWGDDYEVVDYDSSTDIFIGRNSHHEYEDEMDSSDVSLLTAEREQTEFIQKAAVLSVAYNLAMETSLSLVSLADKTSTLLARGNGELTAADQLAFATDLQHLSGVTLADVFKAAQDEATQKEVVKKIATKIGTSVANLETRILPELFGVQL